MILVLHDTNEGYPFVADRLKRECRKVYSPQKSSKYLTWIAGAWKAMRESRKGDIIVSLYDFQGILCLLSGYLTFRRRHILGINLLLKDKPTARNRFASALYRHAVQSPWFTATVTSEAYRTWFNSKLGLNINFPLLRDVYYNSYEPIVQIAEGDGSIFCGGRNSRDWNLMFKLAALMPDTKFRFIMPTDKYIEYRSRITPNITALHEIPMDEFLDHMNHSSIICMPVTTDAPAGLITMFQAAGYKKPIISTRTVTTCEYLTHDRGYLMPNNDSAIWQQAIIHIRNHYTEAMEKARNFHTFVTTECSEAKYVAEIEHIIDTRIATTDVDVSATETES